MNKDLLRIIATLLLTIVVAGCGSPPATPTTTEIEPEPTATVSASSAASSTPDPCSLPQLETEVQEVHGHMREFDDASILASNMPREQLSDSIADLQRIRREAEDELIPNCLTNLKTIQVQHMNSVISTLIAFMGGTDQQSLDQGISLAREQHDEYIVELARLLGLTAVAATAPPAPLETPTP
jgi:hypothetical protein